MSYPRRWAVLVGKQGWKTEPKLGGRKLSSNVKVSVCEILKDRMTKVARLTVRMIFGYIIRRSVGRGLNTFSRPTLWDTFSAECVGFGISGTRRSDKTIPSTDMAV